MQIHRLRRSLPCGVLLRNGYAGGDSSGRLHRLHGLRGGLSRARYLCGRRRSRGIHKGHRVQRRRGGADQGLRRARVLDLVGLHGVELNVFCEFRGNVCVRIDGVHRANLNTGHAIDAVVGMNHYLRIHLVEARDRADFYTVGEFASVTFLGHNMGHSV